MWESYNNIFVNNTSLQELDLNEIVVIRSSTYANCNSFNITAQLRVLSYLPIMFSRILK